LRSWSSGLKLFKLCIGISFRFRPEFLISLTMRQSAESVQSFLIRRQAEKDGTR